MCLAIPGKVAEIHEDKFIIDYGNEKREAIMSVIEDLKIGDYVIVSNKIIVNKLNEAEAKKAIELFK